MTKDKESGGKEDPPEDGDALWDYITQGIDPLRNNKFHASAVDPAVQKPSGRQGTSQKESLKPKSERTTSPILPDNKDGQQDVFVNPEIGSGEIDRGLDERLRRGRLSIDMRIDLHGHTQIEAQHILQTTLFAAYRAQKRCILVITGKGRHSPRGEGSHRLYHGVLRQKVPEWLTAPPLSGIVLKCYGARPKDGGTGAFYVLLRRRK